MRILCSTLFIAFLITFQSCVNNTDPISQADDLNDKAATALTVKQNIEPAFADFDVQLHKLTVTGPEAQTLHLPSGSSIDVPAAAFVDADGNPVTGYVDVVFREFHNAAEIMASGIPMKVMGENGEEDWMQTAGMYEINGSQHGEPVFVAPGKSLTVNLVSEVDGEYDFWNFDPEVGNWANLGVSTPVPNPNEAQGPENAAAAKTNAGPPPAAPIAFRKDTPPIDLDVNLAKYPELADKQNVVWQYAGKDASLDPANNTTIFQQEWDEVNLVANADGQTYTVTLSNDDQELTLPIAPVLKGKDLEQAMADYQARLADYKKKLASVEEVNNFRRQQDSFVRSFQIEGFGIYNYDILMKWEEVVPVLANFDFGMDIPANLRKDVSVFLIAANGKMVVKFPPSDWKRFRIDPTLDNTLVAVLPGNKMAVLSTEDLKKQMPAIKEAKGQEYVFKMTTQGQEVDSVEEVEERIAAL